MPATKPFYPIKHIANGLLRGRNNGEVVDGDDRGKKCFWIGPNLNLLFVILIAAASFLATWRLLIRVAPLSKFYIFSHPLTASLLKIGIPFNVILGGAILLGGLGLYFLTSFLYRDKVPAVAAALFYFFLLSFGASSPFAERIFSGGGEVVFSLGFILPASYFYLLFVNRDGRTNFISALILFALAGLASGMGVFFGLCFYILLGISEIFLGGGRIKLGRIILAIVCSCLLISFWYHPGFVFGRFGMWRELGVIRNMIDLIPIFMVSVPILATITFLLFDRRDELQAVFVSLSTLIACLFIYIFGSTFDKPFIPNTYRLALITVVPFALLFGVVFSHLLRFFDLFKEYVRIKLSLSYSAIFVVLVLAILIVLNFPGRGEISVVDVSEGGWFWLSTGKADFRFFAGVLISLLTAGGIVFVTRKTWPKDSYLDRVFSPRGAYEE